MTSVIVGKDQHPAGLKVFPKPIMEWSEGAFRSVFDSCHRTPTTSSSSELSASPLGVFGGHTQRQRKLQHENQREAMVDFRLTETDYVLRADPPSGAYETSNESDLKIGGNAQAISRERWLHHTSWLWDFEDATMGVLAEPTKRPDYRKKRTHLDFLTRIKHYIPDRDIFVRRLREVPASAGWMVQEVTLADVAPWLETDHVRLTKEIF